MWDLGRPNALPSAWPDALPSVWPLGEWAQGQDNAAFETMWGFGPFTNVGVAAYANGSGWGQWNPKTQAVMVADDAPASATSRATTAASAPCSRAWRGRPPPRPSVPILTKNFPISQGGGFPLGLYNGHTLAPPPPDPPVAGNDINENAAAAVYPSLVALAACIMAALCLFL